MTKNRLRELLQSRQKSKIPACRTRKELNKIALVQLEHRLAPKPDRYNERKSMSALEKNARKLAGLKKIEYRDFLCVVRSAAPSTRYYRDNVPAGYEDTYPYSGTYRNSPKLKMFNGWYVSDDLKTINFESNLSHRRDSEKLTIRFPAAAIPDRAVYLRIYGLGGSVFATKSNRKNLYQLYDRAGNKCGLAHWHEEDGWEHGTSMHKINRERLRKRVIARKKAQRLARNRKLWRKARLAVRLCDNLQITKQNVSDAGACDQGIENFCRWHGLVGESVSLSVIRGKSDFKQFAVDAVAEALWDIENAQTRKEQANVT